MKITNSIILSVILATSIFYARSSTANECSNSSSTTYETSDLVSVGARTLKAKSRFKLYKQGFSESDVVAVFACTVTEKTLLTFAIPDDSQLSVLDVSLFVNGKEINTGKLFRGKGLRLRFSPEKVRDYRIKFKISESETDGSMAGDVYILQ